MVSYTCFLNENHIDFFKAYNDRKSVIKIIKFGKMVYERKPTLQDHPDKLYPHSDNLTLKKYKDPEFICFPVSDLHPEHTATCINIIDNCIPYTTHKNNSTLNSNHSSVRDFNVNDGVCSKTTMHYQSTTNRNANITSVPSEIYPESFIMVYDRCMYYTVDDIKNTYHNLCSYPMRCSIDDSLLPAYDNIHIDFFISKGPTKEKINEQDADGCACMYSKLICDLTKKYEIINRIELSHIHKKYNKGDDTIPSTQTRKSLYRIIIRDISDHNKKWSTWFDFLQK